MVPDTSSQPTAYPTPVPDRPDVFLSYAREDSDFVEGGLARALAERGKEIWIDIEDIRGGASDWRANVWAGIESAKVIVFVLTPDSLKSRVCGEELQRAVELNKRIVPVLRRSVDGLAVPPALERPNWISARADDDLDASVSALVAALELDEAWLDQHARFTQRTTEWLRHDRDSSYLLRGSDLRAAERWLDDQAAHREAPTPEQVAYITAGLRETARRQRRLLGGVVVALVATTTLAILALIAQQRAEDRQRTAEARASAAQANAALSRDPEEAVRRALRAVEIRSDEPEAVFALRRAVASAGWQSMLRLGGRREAAPLTDVEFSADGRRAASAGEDGKVAVWDTGTGERLAVVAHPKAVQTVQFGADGRQLLTASQDGTARTWDSASGRAQHVLDTRADDDLFAATYAASGRLIFTAAATGAQIWDAASGDEVARLPGRGEPAAMRLSLDGRLALTPAGASGDAWLWRVSPRRRLVATLPGTGQELTFALFSRDGRRILTVDSNDRTTVWTTAGGAPVARFRTEGMTDVDLSGDGRLVVTADRRGRARVWDVRSRRVSEQLRNGGSLRSALFDRAGRYFVTGDVSGVVRVWSVTGGPPVAVLRGHTAAIARARFSRDGTRLATASVDGSARLWRAPQTPADPRWRHADSTTFSPDSRRVLVLAGTRRAVWDSETGSIVRLAGGIWNQGDPPSWWPCGHAAGCSPWSPDGRYVAGADKAGRAVVWDARTGAALRRVGPSSGSVIGVAFSGDGRRLVIADANRRRAHIWNLEPRGREATVPFDATGDVVWSAQFVGDSPRVLTVDFSGRAQLSDPASGSATALPANTEPAAVAASGDGRQVAVGTTDGELRVFSGGGGMPRVRRAGAKGVTGVSYDGAGRSIATVGQDDTARIWNARTLAQTTLRAPGGAVTSARFSADGRFVLVSSGSIARLWDLELQRVVLELPRTRRSRPEFSPDGRSIVIAGDSRLAVRRCYACLPLDALEPHARTLLPAP